MIKWDLNFHNFTYQIHTTYYSILKSDLMANAMAEFRSSKKYIFLGNYNYNTKTHITIYHVIFPNYFYRDNSQIRYLVLWF